MIEKISGRIDTQFYPHAIACLLSPCLALLFRYSLMPVMFDVEKISSAIPNTWLTWNDQHLLFLIPCMISMCMVLLDFSHRRKLKAYRFILWAGSVYFCVWIVSRYDLILACHGRRSLYNLLPFVFFISQLRWHHKSILSLKRFNGKALFYLIIIVVYLLVWSLLAICIRHETFALIIFLSLTFIILLALNPVSALLFLIHFIWLMYDEDDTTPIEEPVTALGNSDLDYSSSSKQIHHERCSFA